jgi:hypothetical protein
VVEVPSRLALTGRSHLGGRRRSRPLPISFFFFCGSRAHEFVVVGTQTGRQRSSGVEQQSQEQDDQRQQPYEHPRRAVLAPGALDDAHPRPDGLAAGDPAHLPIPPERADAAADNLDASAERDES